MNARISRRLDTESARRLAPWRRGLSAALAALMLFIALAHDASVVFSLDSHGSASHHSHEGDGSHAHRHDGSGVAGGEPANLRHGDHCDVCLVALYLPFIADATLELSAVDGHAAYLLAGALWVVFVDLVVAWRRKRKRAPPFGLSADIRIAML